MRGAAALFILAGVLAGQAPAPEQKAAIHGAVKDTSGAPVALCIIANHAPDAPIRSERRDDLSLAWWSNSGRSHLVIGRIPLERAVALAQTLEKRI